MQPRIKPIDQARFEQLCSGARTVESHPIAGPKVLINDESNRVIKIFYVKTGVHWKKLFPRSQRALRFARHAQQLLTRHICAPQITDIYQYPCEPYIGYILCYEKIPGIDLYTLLQQDKNVLEDYILFWRQLHEQGIFFRGIHLGNILKHNHDFALIDIEDCYFYNKPLSLSMRARNIAHVFKRAQDKALLPPLDQFMQLYFQKSDLSPLKQIILTQWMRFLLR